MKRFSFITTLFSIPLILMGFKPKENLEFDLISQEPPGFLDNPNWRVITVKNNRPRSWDSMTHDLEGKTIVIKAEPFPWKEGKHYGTAIKNTFIINGMKLPVSGKYKCVKIAQGKTFNKQGDPISMIVETIWIKMTFRYSNESHLIDVKQINPL